MSDLKPQSILPLKNKNVLYVGLSFMWGVKERKIISDILAAIESGANVHLYTLRDSSLAQAAKKHNITCTFHQGAISVSIVKWKRLKAIRKLINHHAINVVHCYDINVLWPLSYFLKSKPLIPLILSLVTPLKKSYRSFWYGPLSRRLDLVLITYSDMSENVYGFLGIPPIKVKVVDFGINIPLKDSVREKPFFRYSEDRFYCGTHLSGLETSTTFLDPLFYGLKAIIAGKEKIGKDITFVLGSEKNWRECLVTEEVRRKVKDWGLEDYVAFMGPCTIADLQADVDLWIDLSEDTQFSDSWASSLIMKTPLLIPRTGGAMELARLYPKSLELYRPGDARELRAKWAQILMKLDSYNNSLEVIQEKLEEQYNSDEYTRLMASTYSKLIKRRKRLVMGRKKKKSS